MDILPSFTKIIIVLRFAVKYHLDVQVNIFIYLQRSENTPINYLNYNH